MGISFLLLARVECIYRIRTNETNLQYSFSCIHGRYLITHWLPPPPEGLSPFREAPFPTTWNTTQGTHKTESFPKPSQATCTLRTANPGYKSPFHSVIQTFLCSDLGKRLWLLLAGMETRQKKQLTSTSSVSSDRTPQPLAHNMALSPCMHRERKLSFGYFRLRIMIGSWKIQTTKPNLKLPFSLARKLLELFLRSAVTFKIRMSSLLRVLSFTGGPWS